MDISTRQNTATEPVQRNRIEEEEEEEGEGDRDEEATTGPATLAEKSASASASAAMLEFPEGGTRAWIVTFGCFCVMFYTFGYLNAFG